MTSSECKKERSGLTHDCEEVVPKDRYNTAYLIFYLLGCGTLLPWNFFITANEYFAKKLNTKPKLAGTFQNYFSVASMAPNLLMMTLNVFVMHRYSRYTRMVSSITVVMILFGVTSALVLLDTRNWTHGFFVLTMVKMVVMSFAISMFQGALFGMAGLFPSRYIQAVMAGQGLGGFIACAANIISLAADGNDPLESAFGYFCTGTFALVLSLVAYIILEKLPIVKFYTKNIETCFCNCQCSGVCHRMDLRQKNNIKESKEMKTISADKQEGVETIDDNSGSFNYYRIFKQILPMAISAFTVFFVTLSMFPSTTARIKSSTGAKNEWTERYFTPVGCFLLYNTFDYIGKALPSFIQKPSSNHPWRLVVLSCLRVVFIPIFVFCNVQPRTNGSQVFFKLDGYYFAFMTLFSLSNGYLGSLAMMYGPRYVAPQDAEVAATTLAFCIVAGLAGGAAFSFGIAPNI